MSIMPKKDPVALPAFWVSVAFGVFYVPITLIYSFLPLSGKTAMQLSLVGVFVALGFGLSIFASIVSVFLWKTYKMAYAPLLVSVLTLGFLYHFWLEDPQTYQAQRNGHAAEFWHNTGFELPKSMSDIEAYDSGPSFNGDGDAELSFRLPQAELKDWMQRSGFEWEDGPHHTSGEELNQYKDADGFLVFRDGTNIKYSVIDRTPNDARGYSSNTTTIYADEGAGWVLIVDSDS